MSISSPRGSKINERKYPGIRGKRPDLKARRKVQASERNAAYAALPLEVKKGINPKKFAPVNHVKG